MAEARETGFAGDGYGGTGIVIPPPHASGAAVPNLSKTPNLPVLPMALVGLLLSALMLQFAVPKRTPLPEVGPSRARVVARRIAPITPVVVSDLLTSKTLFSPSRSFDPQTVAAANAPPPPPDPFDGATLAGIARSRRFAVAVLKRASGETLSLSPGARIGNWYLLAVTPIGARFVSKGKFYLLRVGEMVQLKPLAGASTGNPTGTAAATPGNAPGRRSS